jgi:hypothetical protein
MKQPKDNLNKLKKRLTNDALALIRTHTNIEFSEKEIVDAVNFERAREILNIPEGYYYQEEVVKSLYKISFDEFKTFSLSFKRSAKWSQDGIVIGIKDGFEWDDVITEAWSYSGVQNQNSLSENAIKLLEWVKGKKNTGNPLARNILGAQAKLRGSGCYDRIEDYCREIRKKVEPCLCFAKVDGEIKIWFSAEPRKPRGAENPELGISIKDFKYSDLSRFREWLYSRIQTKEFVKPDEPLFIYEISDRKTYKKCFPKFFFEGKPEYEFKKFLNELDLVEGLKFGCSFEKGEPWLIACMLETGWTWDKIKSVLKAKENELPLEKKYDLSPDAIALLKWILELPKDHFLGKLTPVIEDVYETKIGITTEWDDDNIPAYIQMLLDEINEKTEYNLKIQPWKDCGKFATRILVEKKPLKVDQIVRQVQLLGLEKNKILEGAPIKAWLEQVCS